MRQKLWRDSDPAGLVTRTRRRWLAADLYPCALRSVGTRTDRAPARKLRSRMMSQKREPDPDATIPEARAIQKALTDCWAEMVAHDAFFAATHVEDVRGTLDKVIQLQSWLEHYSEALRQREP
jgi:hypothetical protein